MNRIVLNNMQMDIHRRSPVYQTLLIDLANAGILDKKVVEGLLGATIPDYLRLPVSFPKKTEGAATTESSSEAGAASQDAEAATGLKVKGTRSKKTKED